MFAARRREQHARRVCSPAKYGACAAFHAQSLCCANEPLGRVPNKMEIPQQLEAKMDEAIGHYPADQKRSASLPLLHLWQEHFGFISDHAVTWIAAKLGLQPINILELVTFYPMFRQAPIGR